MAKRNREIELKLKVKNSSFKKVCRLLQKKLNFNYSLYGFSKDLYWKAVDKNSADFIRLRFHSKKTGELTVKHQDKGDSFDRVEIDLTVNSPFQAKALLEQLLGPSIGKIEKQYKVFFFDQYNNISVYYIPDENALFIEIEATSKQRLKSITTNFYKIFPFETELMNKSLFDLYINPCIKRSIHVINSRR